MAYVFAHAALFGKTTLGKGASFATTRDKVFLSALFGDPSFNDPSAHNCSNELALLESIQGAATMDFTEKHIDQYASFVCLLNGYYLPVSLLKHLILVPNGRREAKPVYVISDISYGQPVILFPFLSGGYLVAFHPDILLYPETYQLDGFPYIRLGESAPYFPTGMYFKSNSRVARTSEEFHVMYDDSTENVIPLNFTASALRLSRCFVDSISQLVHTSGGPAMKGGLGSHLFSAFARYVETEAICFYVPTGRDDPMMNAVGDGYVNGKSFVGDWINEKSPIRPISLTSRTANGFDRDLPFVAVSERYTYGNKCYFDRSLGTITRYSEPKALHESRYDANLIDSTLGVFKGISRSSDELHF